MLLPLGTLGCLCRLSQRAPLALLPRPILSPLRSFSRRAAARAEASRAVVHSRRVAEARKAEAEACAAENEVHAARARAEVEAAKAKIDVEVAARKARAVAYWGLLVRCAGGTVALGALWLGYDHLTHSFGPYVLWQMKRKLREGPLEQALPKTPAHEFPMSYPSFSSGLPILVLGHTGSGKSTILGGLARDFKRRGVPVVYFRLRALGTEGNSPESRSETQTFSSAATAVFEAIGYPPRPSLLSRLFFRRGVVGTSGMHAEVGAEDARVAVAHFQHAVSDLFRVCKELYGERGHCSEVDRAPVILADELHDLIHNDRLKKLGGETIFRHLAAEFTSNCTDAKSVRFCAAASSFALQHELMGTAAQDFRARVFTTTDPPAEAVRQQLCAAGFSEASAELIMGTCGTRLRLLSPFLSPSGPGPIDIVLELQRYVDMARNSIEMLFTLVQEDAAAKRQLGLLLDKLCAGGGGGAARLSGLPRQLQGVPFASPFSNPVLYLDSGKKLEMQSQPYCVAWKEMRESDFRYT